jgi:hypothetical protein
VVHPLRFGLRVDSQSGEYGDRRDVPHFFPLNRNFPQIQIFPLSGGLGQRLPPRVAPRTGCPSLRDFRGWARCGRHQEIFLISGASFPQQIFSNCDVQPGLRNLDVELWDYASPKSQKLQQSTQTIARLLHPGHSLDSQFGTPARPPGLD